MTRLSVIIVNYNVKYFLEQALYSVIKSLKGIPSEIFVVDNDSSDGSVDMVRRKFPQVQLIENQTNAGFSKANNQAITQASGEYILLLNPDTVVEEDTFKLTLNFMDDHPEAGALGVKMIDGRGNFLPESKRGLPTPMVAFHKIFGLSALFPKSRLFSRYHLGYLDENSTHEVEVLSGAFMLIRRKALNEVGLLDEDYFMYGEDIDLSYRIIKAGYKNYYFPGTRIIHYKGESTKKGSLNYVRMFYHAMNIFARKHFSGGKAKAYSAVITVAIFLKAVLTLLSAWLKRLMLPLADAAMLYGGMYLIKQFWATRVKEAAEYYPEEYMVIIVPVYVCIWVVSVFFSGGYDRPVKLEKVARGVVIGTVVIAAVYAFLDESLRFSRAMILLGAGWAAVSMISLRILINLLSGGKYIRDEKVQHRIVIVGSINEGQRALGLIHQAGIDHEFIGYILPGTIGSDGNGVLGTLDELEDIVEVYQVNEVVFCSLDVPSYQTIEWMAKIGPAVSYKTVPEESLGIIGSNSKNTAGDLYAIDINLSIITPESRRNKRLLDILTALLLLMTVPVNIFFVNNKINYLQNIFLVLAGSKTWVGYKKSGEGNTDLPSLKEGVLSPSDKLGDRLVSDSTHARLNMLYAKNYTSSDDLSIIFKGFRNLGRS